MRTKRVIILLMVLLWLPGSVRADDIYLWTGALGDDWMTAANWDVAAVPANGALGGDADATIGSTTPLTWPVLDAGDMPPVIDDLWIANGSGLMGELLVQGGVTLTCTDDLKIGYDAGSVYAKLTVKDAGTTVLGLKSLELGADGTVVIDVDGGTLVIGEVDKPKWNMIVAEGADANVTILIRNGGLLEHHGDYAEDDRGGLIIGDGTALIDIGSDSGFGSGTLKLKNDVRDLVRSLYHDGIIVADGGDRDVRISFFDGYTYVTASDFTTRINPSPSDGATVLFGPARLGWTLPEPSVPGGLVTCDVYFGTHPDVEANPKVVVRQAVESLDVTLVPLTEYYWALDLYDSSVSMTEPIYLSPMYRFNTMNMAPDVNAGADVTAWLENGLKVVPLEGFVSDQDGGPGSATYQWTVISEPNALNPAQISDPFARVSAVTLKELGSYTLQFEAGDGEFVTTDTLQIMLYADACDHARHQAGFEILLGDTNNDCIVDFRDLANLASSWLQKNDTMP
ncbi:MAG: hypothetical protein K9N55_09900 [Phycisphaerae bacterium]|nr:hypothetical protein [Phycisphaerae bacterium]